MGELGWCLPVQGRMWSIRVVIDPPCFDDPARLSEVAEQVFIQLFRHVWVVNELKLDIQSTSGQVYVGSQEIGVRNYVEIGVNKLFVGVGRYIGALSVSAGCTNRHEVS